MSTFTQTLYQIVFSTHDRQPTLIKSGRDVLFAYIVGLLKNKKCHPYRIGGVEDHIHIITDLHPTISLAGLVKDIKLATSGFIKKEQLFPQFSGWQQGYGAFTYSISSKENLIDYVMNQEKHHSNVSSLFEMRSFLEDHKVKYDPRYLK